MPCWAECLGDCSNKMTREHLVSESLFPNGNIRVEGFPWCADGPKYVRQRIKPHHWNVVRHKINGPLFERWFLKTLINISCDREYPIGRDSNVAGRPSERLVRIAYGLEKFAHRAGLSFVVRTGMRVESADTFKFSPLVKNRSHIEGGLFVFRGQSLLLFLEPEGAPEPLDGIVLEGEDLGKCQLNFHNKTSIFLIPNQTECRARPLRNGAEI